MKIVTANRLSDGRVIYAGVDNQPVEVVTKGRHDPCVGIRATPIAEAMLALVVMEHALRQRAQCGEGPVSATDAAGAGTGRLQASFL